LGTGDLKKRFSVSAFDIANGAGALVQIVQKSETGRGGGAPQVLLLASPPVAVGRAASALTGFTEMFEGAKGKSERLAEHYARVAQERGCAFLDTGQVIVGQGLLGGSHRMGCKLLAVLTNGGDVRWGSLDIRMWTS
jgi:hypothetical protein